METGLHYCIILLLTADIIHPASFGRAKDGNDPEKYNVQNPGISAESVTIRTHLNLEHKFANDTVSNQNKKSGYRPNGLTEGGINGTVLAKNLTVVSNDNLHQDNDGTSSGNYGKQNAEYIDPGKIKNHDTLAINNGEETDSKFNSVNTLEGKNSYSSRNKDDIDHVEGDSGGEKYDVRNIENEQRNTPSVETKADTLHTMDHAKEGTIPVQKVIDPVGANNDFNENETLQLNETEEIRNRISDFSSHEMDSRVHDMPHKHNTTQEAIRNSLPENSNKRGEENVHSNSYKIESDSTNLQHQHGENTSQETVNKIGTVYHKWLINIGEGETHTYGDNSINKAESKPTTEEHQELTDTQKSTETQESTETEGPAETQESFESREPAETQELTETRELNETQKNKTPASARAFITISTEEKVTSKAIIKEHNEKTVLAREIITESSTHDKQTSTLPTASVTSTSSTVSRTTSTQFTDKQTPHGLSYLTGRSTIRISRNMIPAKKFESTSTRTLHGVDAVPTTQTHPIICSGEYTRGAVITGIIGGVILGGGLVTVFFIFKSRCRRYIKGDYRPVPMEYDFELNPRYKTR